MQGSDVNVENQDVQALFDVGAHFGYSKSRRHPSAHKHLFGTKNRTDIFDLEKTATALQTALDFVAKIASEGRQVLFVGGKNEVVSIVKSGAEKAGMPFVAGRWIGGTLTNGKQVRSRIDRLTKLRAERDSGEREKYTKKERLLMDREIEELEFRFGGLEEMEGMPAALFVIDTRAEHIAVAEANQMRIPVIGLASSDNDFNKIQYAIPANDAVIKSVSYIVDALAEVYRTNHRAQLKPVTTPQTPVAQE